MFKFEFAKDTANADEEDGERKEEVEWIPASKLHITAEQITEKYEVDYYTESKAFPGYNIKLLIFDQAIKNLIQQGYLDITMPEALYFDRIPAKYEGGLKIWECTYDLSQYIAKEQIDLENKLVMDLGCGAGLIGLIALYKNSTVHFQDYNIEVLKSMTVPNVLLNFNDYASILPRCEFYAGDWESFLMLLDDDSNRKYDYIFTSETTYNLDNHRKLYEVFKRRLNVNGVVLVAGKTCYFGVGGGMRQFENLVLKDGYFNIKSVWKNQCYGVNREILELTRKSR